MTEAQQTIRNVIAYNDLLLRRVRIGMTLPGGGLGDLARSVQPGAGMVGKE